ncbi:MAG TPA: helix-turn-helix domain-containing protein [Oligoflexus sp.]|uniref:helix-turn-helix domain-containing protein n=1 Tax=Oligoflexus sp. TaxID=1971216 RepID=UPI002D5EE32C|nr:helix-turn-helix domain-containing protein [Oligoflexus sp.]HYX39955.1 helix-turn-helix domain-containing protein [Oligoflexus sp.]
METFKTLADVEREHILHTLQTLKGNRTQTARALKIALRTLQRKLLAYGLTPGVCLDEYQMGKQVYCKETGRTYPSLTAAANDTGLNLAQVSIAARYETSIKGLTFKRVV